MKRTFVFLAVVVIAIAANAIPAKRGIKKLLTKDGTIIEAELVGDEYHHCLKSLDGYIVKKTDDNYYIKSNEKFDEQVATEKHQMVKMQRETSIEPKSIDGTKTNYATKGLAILVSFSNKAFTQPQSGFSNLLNQNGYSYNGATGSAKDYFNATSYGKYNPTFDVYGPYTLDHTMSYYGQNDWYGSDSNPDEMVTDAVEKLVAAEGSSILNQYDCDGDGYVDNVFIFYAGYAESSTGNEDEIWPHRWVVSSTPKYGSKRIYDYACSSEFDGESGSTRTGIGAFTHEFSHVLGLPDLYNTGGYGSWATPSSWDIMDYGCYNNNEKTPPAYSAQERFYVGWLTPTVINEQGTFTLDNLNNTTAQAYMITSTGQSNLNPTNPSPSKYYLLENRRQSGWDAYLPGHGMLVWKIQYSSSKWEDNTVNNSKNNLGCMIVAAGGDQKSEGTYVSAASDPFPGTKKIDSYTPFTNYALREITETNGTISFVLGSAVEIEDVAEDNEPVILREKVIGGKVRIERLKEGMIITVVDALGRELMKMNADSDIMEFDAPEAVYFIRIE